MTITHLGVTIETLPDSGWAAAYRLGVPNVHVAPDLPPYASPQLRNIWLNYMAAGASQRCQHCDTASLTPAEAKTAPAGAAVLTDGNDIHADGCPYTEANFHDLAQAENPFPGDPFTGSLAADSASDRLVEIALLVARAASAPTLT